MSERSNETITGTSEAIPAGVVLTKVYDPTYEEWLRTETGRIVLDDTLDNEPLKWAASGTGTPAVTRDTTTVFKGTASLKLVTRTSGAAADDVVTATQSVMLLGSKKIRCVTYWRFEDVAKNKYVDFIFTYYDGTDYHKLVLRYDPPNAKWQYLNSSNAYADVGSGAQDIIAAAWSRLEVDLDFNTDYYTRFTNNALSKTMGSTAGYSTTSATLPKLDVSIQTQTIDANAATMFADEIKIIEISE